jgi:DNA helicase-2/ATP-dependent DNA helicase PcrA
VTIADVILQEYPRLNAEQKAIIGHSDGPLLVIAGPGSGKTFSLVLRTLNLLLLQKAEPRELVVCTFTEKAAFELRDRTSAAAAKLGYTGDLSELRATTIHGLCNRLLTIHRHRTPLGSNYETLDDLTQLLFIFDNFKEIVGEPIDGLYLTKWKTRWTAIEGVRDYFNKITEELVDAEALKQSATTLLSAIGGAYQTYARLLFEKNRIDFAHLQKLVYELLLDPTTADPIIRGTKYVMVDEYQDTNYIQEQILEQLTERSHNLCVVGDEDQSLYRFRGATVRNLLEFKSKVPDAEVVKLTTNYRSHESIVNAYDRWMASADWSNRNGPPFRFDKRIQPDPESDYPDYPAIFSILTQSERDEGQRFADFVSFLKEKEVIEDYNQVALLLRSVRPNHSSHYLEALAAKGIPAFCPRARAYFDNEEIQLMVGCLALIFGYHGEGRGNVAFGAVAELARYVDDCLVGLARQCKAPHPLAQLLQEFVRQIYALKEGDSLDLRPADYFYQLIAMEPFASFVKNENSGRTLAIFSQLLNIFQNYYHYTVVTYRNREYIRFHLFNNFLRLLHDGGINEYEDPEQPFPRGYVQVMTIHQSKGLEFPVVVVGSLDKQMGSPKLIDRNLQPFYRRPAFEPENRITDFDRMRLHYVAFSRPEKILVLTCASQPKPYFSPIWQGLEQWPYVQQGLLAAQNFELKDRMPVKRAFSFTGDLKLYETCPRQYQFFREYDFTPSRSAVIFFGLLVHQTIEEIHRIVLDGKLKTLTEPRIRELFDRTFAFLLLSDVRPIGQTAKDGAYTQVLNYFYQNQDEMQRVIETEVDVSVEKDDYILTGKIDLLMGGDGRLELLDFKTSPKPVNSPELLATYERQLCTYAHILEKRYGKKPDRLILYWTAEEKKSDALTQFPYRPELVDEAARDFDIVVRKIKSKNFQIVTVPESKICKECDLRSYCVNQGTIQ